MAKSELGTKRICPTTGRKFYDLNKSPVISPYTGEVVPIAPLPRARNAVPKEEAAEVPENQDVELVSLEDADAENSGKKALAGDGTEDADDIELDDDGGDDDDTFIEEEEEGDDDVTDIIGDVNDEEET